MTHDEFEEDFLPNPIRDLNLIGNWDKNSGFNEIDRRLLQSPKGVDKIRMLWGRTPHLFDIFFVNSPKTNKPQFREVGLVAPEFVSQILGLHLPIKPDATTIIFTNNYGAEKIHMSGWIMAHRFGHALSRINPQSQEEDRRSRMDDAYAGSSTSWNNFKNYIEKLLDQCSRLFGVSLTPTYFNYYIDKYNSWRCVAMHLGTMRSARDRYLRNYFEFGYELLAQYLTTGRIKLNPLTPRLQKPKYTWGRPSYWYTRNLAALDDFNSNLGFIEEKLETLLDGVLDSAEGKVFVM